MRQIEAIVVGGGISGLVCGYALRKAGVEAEVFEATDQPGGNIQSVRNAGYLVELGPQSFSGTAPLRTLCQELGIDNDLVHAPAKAPRYVLVNGKLRPVPLSPPALLVSTLLSVGTKWSIAQDILGSSAPPNEDESVAAFVRRKFSPELLDRLVSPFVSGVYAGDPEQLSVRSAFPQLYEAERSAGSVVRGMLRAAKSGKEPRQKPTLFSFREGTSTLVRALATKIGPALHCRASVTRIVRIDEGAKKSYNVTVQQGTTEETYSANHVILAMPTDIAGKLLYRVNEKFAALPTIEYAPVAVVSLGYTQSQVGHSLDGFGFLVPRSQGLRVLGTVWNSSLFPGRAPQGNVLLTSFVGGATDPNAVTLSAQEIINTVHREIAGVLAIREGPTFSHVEIYSRALPQYNLGHGQKLKTLEELRRRSPNVWLTGNYLRGPAIGACVEQSLEVAAAIAKLAAHPA